MPDAVARLFRRDRAAVLGAIAVVTALAWLFVLRLAAGPETTGMDMPGMDMPGMAMAPAPWGAAEAGLVFAMWTAMMVGMMLPSAAPMVLIYAGVARQAERQGTPFAPTGWFAGGYALAWTGFALVATAAQLALERAALLSPATMALGGALGGLVLVAAGLYQWTPLKDTCLAHCQSPLAFIMHHGGFRRDPGGALRLGLRHGLYCIGCCWALMGLLFVGGIMNPLWIAALAVFVLLEKVVPNGRLLSRVAGAVLIAWGVWVLAHGALGC